MFDWLSEDGSRLSDAQDVRCEKTGIVTQGILAGTRIASNLGWRSVEAIAPGDKVLTFDSGMQPVVEVRREVLWIGGTSVPEQHWPVQVPTGALNNKVDLTVMPDQGVLVESDVADEALQDPFVVIQARQLVGLRKIARSAPSAQAEVITLVFADEQIVYAEGGALLHSPKPGDLLSASEADAAPRYVIPDKELAALVADEIHLEDSLLASKGELTAALA